MVSNNGTILDEFSESIKSTNVRQRPLKYQTKSPRNFEDPYPTENDDDQNSMNLEDHNGSQELSSVGDLLEGSEELLNMSLSAALASETERMEITFRFFQDPNFLL